LEGSKNKKDDRRIFLKFLFFQLPIV
jgi:hypothetical protein